MSAVNPRAQDPSPPPNKTLAFTQALLSELARAGIAHVCICPGSRSAPLAIAARSVAELRCWIHLDERAAAFFALGLAKASRTPVAVLCTSGTAAANFLPAVIEAHYAQVPLVLLTADRPPELRDWGAGQTIDQLKLFGSHLRWFAEAAPPEASAERLRYARALACRAAATAAGSTPGPVHLNIPLREPLDPTPVPTDAIGALAESDATACAGRTDAPYTDFHAGRLIPDEAMLDRLAAQLTQIERGILAAGPSDEPALPAAMTRLAQAAGWPILADVAAQLRFGAHAAQAPLICHAELFLRDESFAAATVPEFLLRFGATPTSKHFRLWLERHPQAQQTIVDPSLRWDDPSHLASEFLRCDPVELCLGLADRLESNSGIPSHSDWLSTWLEADRYSKKVISEETACGEPLLEPAVGAELADLLPCGTQLYLSSSMPIRDLDNFAPASTNSLRVLCNRGANGIDGVTSSTLGASAARKVAGNPARTVLLTGDLAFLHDLGGLLAARRYELDATLIVLNNDGGGIFSFLPVANFPEQAHFDELFTTPHGVAFETVAELFGLGYARAATAAEFRRQLAACLARSGINLLELIVDREKSVALHRQIARKISKSVLNRPNAGETHS